MAFAVTFQKNPPMNFSQINPMQLKNELNHELIQKYGLVVGGTDLAHLLGFRTADAFRKSYQGNKIKLNTFDIEGRHGRYCLTRDLVDWLVQLRCTGLTSDTKLTKRLINESAKTIDEM